MPHRKHRLYLINSQTWIPFKVKYPTCKTSEKTTLAELTNRRWHQKIMQLERRPGKPPTKHPCGEKYAGNLGRNRGSSSELILWGFGDQKLKLLLLQIHHLQLKRKKLAWAKENGFFWRPRWKTRALLFLLHLSIITHDVLALIPCLVVLVPITYLFQPYSQAQSSQITSYKLFYWYLPT